MAPAILENKLKSSASRVDNPPNPSSPCSSNAVHIPQILDIKQRGTEINVSYQHTHVNIM